MTTALVAVAALPLAFWLAVALDLRRWWPRSLRLPPVPSRPAPLAPAPWARRPPAPHIPASSVAVVIPARNEAPVLGETLPSLLSQCESLEALVVVDDRSTDETREAVESILAASPGGEKVRLVSAEPRPPGWSGKLFALQTGIESIDGSTQQKGAGAGYPEWLLFTDADIRHAERSVDRLLAKAREGEFALVSVMVRLRSESFWERLLIPPFVYFFQLLYPFRRVIDPRSRVAAAAGGCVLVRADALRAAGGLAAIREAVIDDVALAALIKRAGGRCWLGPDPDFLSVRAYETFGEIANMVARTAFTQLGFRASLLVATIFSLGTFVVSPPFLVALGLVTGAPVVVALALAAWGIQAATFLPVVLHQRVPAAYCASLPLAAGLYGYMTGLSAWRHWNGRGNPWKGRSVG